MTSLPETFAPWSLPEFVHVAAVATSGAPDLEALAWNRGWAEGHAAGAERADESVAAAAAARQVASLAVDASKRALREEMARALPALAIAIARIVIEREVVADPTVMQHLVHRAMAMTPLHGTVSVRLHPDDLAALNAGEANAAAAVAVTGELRWVPDDSMPRGSCVVDGPSSIVDGRVDRVLLDLYDRLTHE
ncbi:MAG: FliH/SctL family protein [Gemmatimonadota bacterium]